MTGRGNNSGIAKGCWKDPKKCWKEAQEYLAAIVCKIGSSYIAATKVSAIVKEPGMESSGKFFLGDLTTETCIVGINGIPPQSGVAKRVED